MKYLIPIKAWEEAVQRGKDIASKIPTTSKEQYYEDQSRKRPNRENLNKERQNNLNPYWDAGVSSG